MAIFRTFILTALTLGFLFIVPAALEAQTGSVSGVVTNDAGEAISGVLVKASDGSGGWGGWGNIDFTDVDGNYMIDDLEPGSYELEARRYGFESVTVVVDVADGVNTLRDGSRSFLVITHYQRLLNYIVPDTVHVLMDGRIVETGGRELALQLEEEGYASIEAASR